MSVYEIDRNELRKVFFNYIVSTSWQKCHVITKDKKHYAEATHRWAPSTENGTGTYSLSVAGMVVMVVRRVGRRGSQLMVVLVGGGGDQFPTFGGPSVGRCCCYCCRLGNTRRYTMYKRCGRTLQTSFDHFQRACYYGASSTCDTGERERKGTG